jgi:ATP-GRASP peptide maturase of grasp-with-spasm system
MLLILSEQIDVSTDKVCDWLNYYNAEYIRINTETNSFNIYGNISFVGSQLNFELILNEKSYNLDDISCIWCRRGHVHIEFPRVDDINFQDSDILETIEQHLKNETNTLVHFFEYLIEEKMHINNMDHYNSNKLIALRTAQKIGLKIPETLITQSAKVLKNFIKNQEKIITKDIQDVLSYYGMDYRFGHSTKGIALKDIKTESFFYSLFQKKIDRKYELRIFYWLGKFFTHATIPPQNETVTDIRNSSKQNRHIPFSLPEKIKIKLSNFMKTMNLQSGSIDMIVDKNNDYYFLEVNPVGQFGYVSGYNNYYIEREIAKTLMKCEKS